METLNDGRSNQTGNDFKDALFQGRPRERYRQLGFDFDIQIITVANKRQVELRAVHFEEYVGYDRIDASDQIRANMVLSKRGRLVEAEFVRTLGDHAKDVGVVVQTVADIDVEDRQCKVLDIGVKAIEPQHRNQDLGILLLVDAIVEHDGICYVTGQSRNGRVFSYLEKARELRLFKGEIRGYEKDLTVGDIDEILKPVLLGRKFKQVDKLRTGLLLDIYSPADHSLFEAPTTNEKAVRVVDKLKRRGVAPGGPNGIRYLAEVNEETVRDLREEYKRIELLEVPSTGNRYRETLLERLAGLLGFPPKVKIGFSSLFR